MKRVIGICGAAMVLAACGGTSGGTDAGPNLGTSSGILAYLEGKTLTMEGANIPSHPNGFSSSVNFGPATQCYKSTTIDVLGGQMTVTSQLGSVRAADGGATTAGQVGTCDTSTTVPFGPVTSTVISFTNVRDGGSCFDFDVTYPSYAQEGRGSITASQMKLELFFKNQFVGIRCADGLPGSSTARQGLADGGTLSFTGNAVQTYVITD